MAWTDAQRDELFEAYWRDETLRCPDDESILDVNRSGHFKGYILYARCPRCNQQMSRGNDTDPQKGTFRPWTAEEIEAMKDEYFKNHHTRCPLCDAEVAVHEIRTFGNMALTLDCPRCRN